MPRYGAFGQWCWLNGGGWTGLWTCELIRANLVTLKKFEDWLLVIGLFISPAFIAVATIAFPLWHFVRTKELGRTHAPWWMSLLFGFLVIGPTLRLCFDIDPIATCVLVNVLSLAAAEACVRSAPAREEPKV